ncbi:MAG: L-rhamnose mutarotase [Saccharofermentanales bacterium]
MKRFGQVIGLKPEKLNDYMELHKAVWPDILKLISECNMVNYSIYYKNGLLFAYFEYIGENFDEDMKKMSDNPINKKWWDVCKPCQVPVENAAEGEWWANMEEIFHLD